MTKRTGHALRWSLAWVAACLVTSAAVAQVLPPCCTETTVSPTVAPRLYIHYRESGQAGGAAALRRALAKTSLAGRRLQVVVPSGEPSSTYARTMLVCERQTDCALAPELAKVLGGILGRQVAINDLSKRYEATTRSRALHYEIWFDRQPIAIAGVIPSTATPAASAGPMPQATVPSGIGPAPVGTAPLPPVALTVTRAVPASTGDVVTLAFSRPLAAGGAGYAVTVDGVAAAVTPTATGLTFVVPSVSRALFRTRTVRFEILVANRYRVTPTVNLELSSLLARFAPVLAALAAVLAALLFWRSQIGQAAEADRAAQARAVVEASRASVATVSDGGQQRQTQGIAIETDPSEPSRPPWEPDPPEALVAAVAAGQAVLITGAAVSEQSGLPSPASFIHALIGRLGSRTPQSVLALFGDNPDEVAIEGATAVQGGPARLLGSIINAKTRGTAVKLLRESLPTVPNPLHQVLPRLPWRAVVDLNQDDLMLRSLQDHSEDRRQIVPVTVSDSQEVVRSFRSGARVLFRPFGAHDQDSTLTFTDEEMRRSVARAPDFQRALSALLQSQPCLFIGVSPETVEQFLYAVAPDHEDGDQRHYLLLPRAPSNALSMSTLARFGVELLEFDPQPDGSGPYRFCEKLRERADLAHPADGHDAAVRSSLSPDRVSRIRLQNIGPFDDIELTVSDGRPAEPVEASDDGLPQSPWWVLFGGNGVGKSTVLRALAVALAGDSPAAAAAGRRLLKADAPHGLIEVQIGSQILKTRIQSERSNVVVVPSQASPVQLGSTLALGFPALRGVRTPDPTGPSARDEIREPEPADLQNLISSEVDGRLADFKQWLVNTLTSASHDPRARQMRDLLNGLIREIIPGQIDALAPLRPGDFVIRVQTPDGEVPFDELSQGMASIFNWVGLLAQRLFTICEHSARPQDEPAIVIIDEIDAHLHPEWQRRLVPLTRKFFPNVQVVATSHSPLLAGSLRLHEIAVLGRNPDSGRVEAVRHGATYGLMSQDIMTSNVFAMATDRNPEVERLIERYCHLYEARDRSEEDEQELGQLRDQLGRYGFADFGSAERPVEDEDHLAALRERLGQPPRTAP